MPNTKRLLADGVELEDAPGYWTMRHLRNGVLTEGFCDFMGYVRITFQYITSLRLTNDLAGSGKSTLMLVTIELYPGETKSLIWFLDQK